MTTDTAKMAERFKKFCKKWNLESNEADAQAHNKALVALHSWLRKGVESPEVVIRAVQVLMADPESPDVHKRPAAEYVFEQISSAWQSAGMNGRHVFILQGMILAAWPFDLREGWFSLTPLFDSVWIAVLGGRLDAHWSDWRLAQEAVVHSKPMNLLPAPPKMAEVGPMEPFEVSANHEAVVAITEGVHQYSNTLAAKTKNAVAMQQEALASLSELLNAGVESIKKLSGNDVALEKYLTRLSKVVRDSGTRVAQLEQQTLLWWGQARYCKILRRPYRRIQNLAARVWWMAWEGSELAMNLETEPSACFLAESLYQLDSSPDERKRPLKEWMGEFIKVTRDIHDEKSYDGAIAVSSRLQDIVSKDPLGLPVSWARVEAANPRPSTEPVEKWLRDRCGVDPDAEMDLGDWTSWVFREALLDRHLKVQ